MSQLRKRDDRWGHIESERTRAALMIESVSSEAIKHAIKGRELRRARRSVPGVLESKSDPAMRGTIGLPGCWIEGGAGTSPRSGLLFVRGPQSETTGETDSAVTETGD